MTGSGFMSDGKLTDRENDQQTAYSCENSGRSLDVPAESATLPATALNHQSITTDDGVIDDWILDNTAVSKVKFQLHNHVKPYHESKDLFFPVEGML